MTGHENPGVRAGQRDGENRGESRTFSMAAWKLVHDGQGFEDILAQRGVQYTGWP